MTTIEMKPLLESADHQVRKLAEQYGTLWDAATDLCTMFKSDDYDTELVFTNTGDAYEKLSMVLSHQPNEEKKT